jgi:hypothetical protein
MTTAASGGGQVEPDAGARLVDQPPVGRALERLGPVGL